MDYQNILVKHEGAVAIITLNRPKALNALNAELLAELVAALEAIDADDALHATVLTGSERAFAAGAGLVARVVPAVDLLSEAVKAAQKIAGQSVPIVMMTKEAINRAYETTLAEGIRFERRVFHAMFATEDQKEGMAAFAEKRPPVFKNR